MANPSAFILSYVMMLKHLGLPFFAQKVENGVYKTIRDGRIRTFDIGGNSSTDEFTEEVINNIKLNI